MDAIQWVILGLVVVFIVTRMLPKKGIMNISAQEAKEKIADNNVQFIDVRTPGEYKANHGKPFKNIPLYNLKNQVDTLDKQKEIVLICQSGIRSSKAATILKKQGFEKIYNIRGGMNAW